MSQYRVNEQRIYEGEWWFACENYGKSCKGFVVEYSLNDYEKDADSFLYNTDIHTNAVCNICHGALVWGGYSGGSPISESLVSLLKSKHYMAATVILAAIIENSLSNLLWASLVDNGMDAAQANKIADGKLYRAEIIKRISSMTNLSIKDLSFPTRNLVAHGKGFLQSSETFKNELANQILNIRNWVLDIPPNGTFPSNFMPTECGRWLLFMEHWSSWLVDYIVPKYLN